jgi:hypothetical protein
MKAANAKQIREIENEYLDKAARNMVMAQEAAQEGDIEFAEYMEECAADARAKAAYFARMAAEKE